jgi:arginase
MQPIKLIEVKSELGAGTRGSSLGIDALKIAAFDYGSYFFGKFKTVEIRDSSRLLFKNPVRSYAKRIRGVVKIFNKLATSVRKEIKAGNFPVVLSGDHSSAGGTIAGIKMAHPNKKIGVIWIDAHADLHSPYTTPSGNIHGMPLATALGIDNLEHSLNPVENENTVPYWETLKNLGKICPKILPQHLVFMGLRDYEAPEADYIRKNNIKVVRVAEVRRGKIREICRSVLTYLEECDLLYVSFDVDALDVSVVKATGTPAKGGFSLKEINKILDTLLKDPRLACFEMTELNPLLDTENQTAKRLFPVFRAAVSTIEKRKKKARKALKKSRVSATITALPFVGKKVKSKLKIVKNIA